MSLFVAEAEKRRGSKSIRQFSQELRLNHSLWSRILRGERQPSSKVIAAILAQYPDLGHWLVEDAKAARIITSIPYAHQAALEGQGTASGPEKVSEGPEATSRPSRATRKEVA